MSQALYEVEIRPPNWQGYKYAVFYGKLHGNYYGGCTEVQSKDELLAFLREIFRRWEEHDGTLGRAPEKVTRQNLRFECFTPEISVAELFGNATLGRFWGGAPPPAPAGTRDTDSQRRTAA